MFILMVSVNFIKVKRHNLHRLHWKQFFFGNFPGKMVLDFVNSLILSVSE